MKMVEPQMTFSHLGVISRLSQPWVPPWICERTRVEQLNIKTHH